MRIRTLEQLPLRFRGELGSAVGTDRHWKHPHPMHVPYKGESLMGAVVYALPATLPFAQATVHALPKRTPSGRQEALPLEWPNSPAPDPIVLRAPRAGIDTLHSFDPQPTRSCDLPPAGPWAMRLVHGMVEVINGEIGRAHV